LLAGRRKRKINGALPGRNLPSKMACGSFFSAQSQPPPPSGQADCVTQLSDLPVNFLLSQDDRFCNRRKIRPMAHAVFGCENVISRSELFVGQCATGQGIGAGDNIQGIPWGLEGFRRITNLCRYDKIGAELQASV
jgi:hypothetical protein